MTINSRTLIRTLAAAALAAAPAFASPDRDPDPRESYSYVRTLEGRATLASEGAGPGDEAEINQPLLVGDRIAVARGARLEVALADRNLLRVGGDTSLTLARIAFSGDRGDRTTRLDLDEGEIVLVVTEEALGDGLPEVRTPGAEIVVHQPGIYRIATDRSGWTELVVRDGYAELVTAAGSSVVRGGESAITFGDRWSGVDLASAGPDDSLERWSDQLDRRAEAAGVLYVEPELADDAAPLAEHGTWVSYDSAWYWRPRVTVDWRPYWLGRWAWTPSGLTWVSSEPWGWVPYHYGTWCQLPGYGWAWRPGRVYSPAWVYWHWSDAWVGWCPVGYYTSWYGPGYTRWGFRFGTYGWASGGWGYYSHWNFGPTYCLRGRDQRRHYRHGRDLERELGPRVPRGLVTTTTRGLPRTGYADEGAGSRELLRRIDRRLDREPLVDVTDFVARRRQLPPDVVAAVQSREGDRIRLADVPRGDIERGPRTSGDRRGDRPDVLTRGRGEPGVARPDGDAGRTRPGAVDERSARGGDRTRIAPRDEVDRRAPTRVEERPAVREREVESDRTRRESQPRTPPPSDRQGWRRDAGDGASSPRVVGERTARPPVPRLRPGERAEIDADGRVRRLPPGDSGRITPRPRSSDGDTARPSNDSRQGWKSAPGRTPPRVSPPTPGGGSGAPTIRRSEPVQRVLGGLRRGDTARPRALPPSSTYRRPETGRVTRPPSGPTRSPQVTPRATPPPTSSPSVQPPSSSRPPSSSTRPSTGSSRPSSATRSSQKSSSRRDSPPPRRKRDKD